MDLVSACPLRVGSILWQTGRGDHTLTVVAKATYTLLPGESPLADEQDPIHESDGYWNYDAASDLAPFKRRADVLLVGNAFAPGGKPVRSLTVRLSVGAVDKSIEVHGDRSFGPDGKVRGGALFAKMRLRWERAAGGPDTSNPVGVRAGAGVLPNLQPPGFPVGGPGDVIPPVCFGPIAPTWPARSRRLHPALAGWDHRRWYERPLPDDLDPAFFNAAPPDQQVDGIRPDERVELENLHPDHPRLLTRLVASAPRVIVERPDAAEEVLGMRCDTLRIDTDRGTCALTWRAQIPLDRRDAPGRVLITLAGDAPRLDAPTLDGAAPFAADLPFVKVPAFPPPPAAPRMPLVTYDLSWGETSDVLPEGFGFSGEALPFVSAADEIEVEDDEEDEEEGRLSNAITLRPPPPAPSVAPPSVVPARSEPPALPAPPELPTPAPPPLLGPLATPEMIAAAEAASKPEEPAPLPATTPTPAPPTDPEPAPAPDPGLPLDRYPIERCAAVAASSARRRDETPAILEAHGLTPSLWESLDRHWADEIAKETGRGRTALLARHDAAYVAQLEDERGPIGVQEYARLVVALERNAAPAALAALDLPRGALLRVQRLWLRRIAGDADLGRAVRAAVEAAREA